LITSAGSIYFFSFFWVALGVWARGVINPGFIYLSVVGAHANGIMAAHYVITSFEHRWQKQCKCAKSHGYLAIEVLMPKNTILSCFGRSSRHARKSGVKGFKWKSNF
jgi:hypothetical protein